VAWITFSDLLHRAFSEIAKKDGDVGLASAVSTVLGLALSNLLQYNCNMSTWLSDGMISVFIQSSSIPMRADYAEANPLMDKLVGGFSYQLERTVEAIEGSSLKFNGHGAAAHACATNQVLADDSASALVTDPPYYFAIPYAELSDFFYVWLNGFFARFTQTY
jgi:adenine-specific DNA methylase